MIADSADVGTNGKQSFRNTVYTGNPHCQRRVSCSKFVNYGYQPATVCRDSSVRRPATSPIRIQFGMPGLTRHTCTKCLACTNPSETSECYFVLANPQRQIWFIPQRHLLAYKLIDSDEFFLPNAESRGLGASFGQGGRPLVG